MTDGEKNDVCSAKQAGLFLPVGTGIIAPRMMGETVGECCKCDAT